MFDFESQDVTGDFYVVNTGRVQNSKTTVVASALTDECDDGQNNGFSLVSPEMRQTNAAHDSQSSSSTSHSSSGTETAKSEATYIVKDGDSLYRIAVNHGLTLSQLCKLNGLKPNSYITRGQILKCR